jgi:hypothetical protein
MPDIKPRPNHAMYIDILRRMTGEERLKKAIELTLTTRELMRAGLRHRHPGASDDELAALAAEALLACHRRNS